MRKHCAAPLVALIAALAVTRTTPADDTPKTGSIKGVVKFTGDMSRANQIDRTDKDAESCGHERPKPSLVVDTPTSALADAVVYVKGKVAGATFTDAQKKILSDQKSCVFEPHVIFVAEGGEVEFKNSDTVLHNVSYSSTANGTFNEGIGPGKSTTKKFDHADFITISCSLHAWMNGLLVVMQNPYYTLTNAKGEFELKDLPAGKHAIVVQHQTLGKADKKGLEVEVKAGETLTENFELK